MLCWPPIPPRSPWSPQVAAGHARRKRIAELTEAGASSSTEESDSWPIGRGRLGQFVRYSEKVFGLRRRLSHVRDRRRKPTTTAPDLAMVVFFTGLLRIRSFNALEPKLAERPFLNLLNATNHPDGLCCVDTLSRGLRVMDLLTVRQVSVGIVQQAERNKVFREGWHGALRYVAIDGWEPFSSRVRHCDQCLVRHLRTKDRNGQVVMVEEYYHRWGYPSNRRRPGRLLSRVGSQGDAPGWPGARGSPAVEAGCPSAGD